MAIPIEQCIVRLSESGLMSAGEIFAFQDGLPPAERPGDVQTLAARLVQAGKLTKFQAQAIYQGKTKGLVIGEYVVLDKLGEGGVGVVLKARHRRMDRLVAIKVLSAAAIKQAGSVGRFQREVKAAAKLSHPNIVAAFDAGEHQGMHYLVTEYVDGKDLAATVKEHGPLGVREAVGCIVQAARGLEYAHRQGIVHRDIKPANLLLDKEGTVKILDMGLARIAGPDAVPGGPERLTTTGQVMGTCDYMAPEQSLDTHQADARADIYSLGCTLYRLLTGHPPYRAETFAKLFLMHLEAPIPSLCAARPEVPEALDAVYARMVAKKPEDRYQSMGEVLEALTPLAEGSDSLALPGRSEGPLPAPAELPTANSGVDWLSATPESPAEQFAARPRAAPPRRRKRTWPISPGWIAVGAAAAVLAAGLLIWGLADKTGGGKTTAGVEHPAAGPQASAPAPSARSPTPAPAPRVPQPKPKPKPAPETKPEPKPEPKPGPQPAETPIENRAIKPATAGPHEPAAVAGGKQPVPDEASLEKARKMAREAFQDEYAKAKTAAQKVAVAMNVRKTARQGTPDPAERFVLLRSARDIAAQVGGARRRVERDEVLHPGLPRLPDDCREVAPCRHVALLVVIAQRFLGRHSQAGESHFCSAARNAGTAWPHRA
jgi:serine/threonine protein kinase